MTKRSHHPCILSLQFIGWGIFCCLFIGISISDIQSQSLPIALGEELQIHSSSKEKLNLKSEKKSASAKNVWMKDYRHIHKKQSVSASAGRFSDIIPPCEKMLKDYPNDAESLFFLAIGHAGLGEKDLANDAIQRAIRSGLPEERFLAGPELWTKPFRNRKEYPLGNSSDAKLIHGPMIGDLRPDGFRVWVRTARPADVKVIISSVEGNPVPQGEFSAKTTLSTDRTAVVIVAGLKPYTRYQYDVEIDQVSQFPTMKPIVRTAPKVKSPSLFRFGFGGGAAYIPRNAYMWSTINYFNPDLFLFLGDNIYIDDPRNKDYQRYLYYRRQSQPLFRELVKETAIYSIWDDHDFGTNDCAGGPAIDTPSWKRPVWEIYQQNWVNRYYGGGETQPGCWFDFEYGDVQFLMLDGRYYRVKQNMQKNNKAATMLGPAQKKWLFDRLSSSKATFKVICSPVPFVGGNPDKWNGFPAERQEIFDFIQQHKIEGVVLLSADRHRSDVLITKQTEGYDLYEFMSSKLTNHHTHGTIGIKDGALFSYNKKCSFGLVTIDSTKADPEILYEILSIDKELIHSFRLRLSQLQF